MNSILVVLGYAEIIIDHMTTVHQMTTHVGSCSDQIIYFPKTQKKILTSKNASTCMRGTSVEMLKTLLGLSELVLLDMTRQSLTRFSGCVVFLQFCVSKKLCNCKIIQR